MPLPFPRHVLPEHLIQICASPAEDREGKGTKGLVLGVKEMKAIKRRFAGVREENSNPPLRLFAIEIL